MKNTLLLLLSLLLLASCNNKDSDTAVQTPILKDQGEAQETVVVSTPVQDQFASAFMEITYSLYRLNNPHFSESEKIELLERLITLSNQAMTELKKFWESPELDMELSQNSFNMFDKDYSYLTLSIINVTQVDSRTIEKPLIDKIIYLAQTQNTQTLYFNPLLSYNGTQGYFSAEGATLAFGSSTLYWLMAGKDLSSTMRHELTHGYFNQKRQRDEDSIYHLQFFKRSLLSEMSKGISDERNYDQFMSAEELYTFANGPYWMNKFDTENFDATEWTIYFQEMSSRIHGFKWVAQLIIDRAQKMKETIDYLAEEYISYWAWDAYYQESYDPSNWFFISDEVVMLYYFPSTYNYPESISKMMNKYQLQNGSDIQDFISKISVYFGQENLTEQEDEVVEDYVQIINKQYNFYYEVYSKLEKLEAIASYLLEKNDALMNAMQTFAQDAEPYWEILRSENFDDPQYEQKKADMMELFTAFKKKCRNYAMYSREGTKEYNSIMPSDD